MKLILIPCVDTRELKLVVCILLRVLDQVQGFRLTQHTRSDGNPEPDRGISSKKFLVFYNEDH
jgi:hypothetical protein